MNSKQNSTPEMKPYYENELCGAFLGIQIAEQLVYKMFTDIIKMPINHPYYDFICNHDKKIDVKAACVKKFGNGWLFNTKKNTITDYFFCIAFDDRKSLTLQHAWLIPSDVIRHKHAFSVAPRTLDLWTKYEINITEATQCCNKLKQK